MRRQLPPSLLGPVSALRSVADGRQVHWIAVDCLAAVALAVVLIDHAAGQQPEAGIPAWAAVAASAVTALMIAVRRVWPTTVYAGVLATNTLAIIAGVSGNPAVTVALALYAVTVFQPPRRSLAALGAALALTLPAMAYDGLVRQPAVSRQVLQSAMVASAVIIGTGWIVGAMQRRYAAQSAGQLARSAVTEERLRIARELHDTVSNAMALITAKAAVTNYLIDSHPDEARSALTVIEETGRGALAEMRQMLGVLRAGQETGDHTAIGTLGDAAPVPGLTGLQALAAQAADAGVPTSVDIRGDGELSQAMALSVYRIVQEALTNVIKHAGPARCTVRVDLTEDDVTVEVADDGQARPGLGVPAGGHGLIGMRERVSLFSGDITAGPRPGGGFCVTAWLPAGATGTVRSSSGRAGSAVVTGGKDRT